MGRGQKLSVVLMSIFLSQLCWTPGASIVKNYYTSTYGVVCRDECKTHGNEYYWCHTRKGWDYCSPLENRDYEGYQCQDEHACGLHGESYYWCRRKAGSWGYCGKVEPKPLLHTSSTYQRVCIDECLYDEISEYFWCHTDQGWDYCSPLTDVTYKNEPCLSDHHCGAYGYSYTWCKTGWFQSDHCGLIKPNECRYDTSSRKRRQPNNAVLICTRTDKGNKKETKFYATPAPADILDGSPWRNEIVNIISRWDNGYLGNQARSGLITSENLRIDLQGFTNNQRYYNLQIQVNRPRQPGTSTTVAQVLIPVNADIPDRYVRMAFTESFRRRARVTVETCLNPNFNPRQVCHAD